MNKMNIEGTGMVLAWTAMVVMNEKRWLVLKGNINTTEQCHLHTAYAISRTTPSPTQRIFRVALKYLIQGSDLFQPHISSREKSWWKAVPAIEDITFDVTCNSAGGNSPMMNWSNTPFGSSNLMLQDSSPWCYKLLPHFAKEGNSLSCTWKNVTNRVRY